MRRSTSDLSTLTTAVYWCRSVSSRLGKRALVDEACLDAESMISFPGHDMHDMLNSFSRLLDAILSVPRPSIF